MLTCQCYELDDYQTELDDFLRDQEWNVKGMATIMILDFYGDGRNLPSSTKTLLTTLAKSSLRSGGISPARDYFLHLVPDADMVLISEELASTLDDRRTMINEQSILDLLEIHEHSPLSLEIAAKLIEELERKEWQVDETYRNQNIRELAQYLRIQKQPRTDLDAEH